MERNATLTSALDPAGPVASALAHIYWLMVALFGAVFFVVMLLLALGLIGRRRNTVPRAPLGDTAFIVIGGLLVPGLILTFILIYTLFLTRDLKPPEARLTIELTGYMWWWDVKYPDAGISLANEIYVPVGEPVRILLKSADVIHSLWIPSLSGKTDLIPGLTNEHWFEASKPGTYRGQCAEYCGLQHAKMALNVVALPRPRFDAWVEEKKKPKSPPDDPLLRLGYDTFFTKGCAECHAIRGTPADGRIGPDLTHLGSRRSLGAGAVANNFGNLAGWVADPQSIKPGNKMPAGYIEPEAFHALISYLMTLE